MAITGPSPETKYPINGYDKLIFLNNFITVSNIIVGDYTYFDGRLNGAENFEKYNVLYNPSLPRKNQKTMQAANNKKHVIFFKKSYV